MLCILTPDIDQKQAGMLVAFVTKVTVSGQTIVRIFITPGARKSASKFLLYTKPDLFINRIRPSKSVIRIKMKKQGLKE
ncbi:MAG: hypothetical protein IAE96_09470 [Chitinophagaceae bacterium]|nr:hypothetical protein [Chitinophagaceae bacterium]